MQTTFHKFAQTEGLTEFLSIHLFLVPLALHRCVRALPVAARGLVSAGGPPAESAGGPPAPVPRGSSCSSPPGVLLLLSPGGPAAPLPRGSSCSCPRGSSCSCLPGVLLWLSTGSGFRGLQRVISAAVTRRCQSSELSVMAARGRALDRGWNPCLLVGRQILIHCVTSAGHSNGILKFCKKEDGR